MRSARRIAAGLVALAALAAPRVAAASPEDVFGFGPRAVAMGATGIAGAEGFDAVHGNPALLSAARSRELSLGFMGAAFDLRANGRRISYEALKGSIIGATLPLPFGGILKDRITLGLGFFTPFRLVVRGRILYPETPEYLLADRTQSVAVQAGAGVRLGDRVRIGAGFAALAALTGSVLVATDASGRIGTTVQDTLVASYGPIAGASVDVGEAWRVGAVFRGKLEGRFSVLITVKDLGQLTVPPLNISGVAQYDPWQIGAEVARTKGRWRGAAGLTFKRWSSYPGPAEATVRCPEIDPGSGEKLESCGTISPPPVDFHDTVVPHVGVERIFEPKAGVRLAVRAGYFFEPTPAPGQTKESNYLDSSRSAFTLGYGLSTGPVDLDLFAQLHVLHARTHTKEASVPATNPGAPSLESTGHVIAVGSTVGVRF